MTQEFECECLNRYPAEINSVAFFNEVKAFFEKQVSLGIFEDMPVTKPYYRWKTKDRDVEWYADKWYVCSSCGCLWELQYPEFPAKGVVRKFVDGQFKEEEYHSE